MSVRMCSGWGGARKEEVVMETSFSLFLSLSPKQTHTHTHTHNTRTVSLGIDKQRTGSMFTFHGHSNP